MQYFAFIRTLIPYNYNNMHEKSREFNLFPTNMTSEGVFFKELKLNLIFKLQYEYINVISQP